MANITKELPFEDQYDENCPHCDARAIDWEWNPDNMNFIGICEDCGAEFSLKPTQGIFDMLYEPEELDFNDEDEDDE